MEPFGGPGGQLSSQIRPGRLDWQYRGPERPLSSVGLADMQVDGQHVSTVSGGSGASEHL